MKLIIDIPDYNLDGIQNGSIACGQILKAVKNGTPYEERPTGHWIKGYSDLDYEEYKCSICGRVIVIYANPEMPKVLNEYPYCNCGATMVKEAHND